FIQTWRQFWMGNDSNHHTFSHRVRNEGTDPYNAISDFEFCHRWSCYSSTVLAHADPMSLCEMRRARIFALAKPENEANFSSRISSTQFSYSELLRIIILISKVS